jgi:hypothetical protein
VIDGLLLLARNSHDEVKYLKDATTRATPDEYEYLKEQVA